MTVHNLPKPKKRWTPSELLKLPPAQRDAILRNAAAQAEREYQNQDLTATEAFGAGDLYGDSANTETRRDLAD